MNENVSATHLPEKKAFGRRVEKSDQPPRCQVFPPEKTATREVVEQEVSAFFQRYKQTDETQEHSAQAYLEEPGGTPKASPKHEERHAE